MLWGVGREWGSHVQDVAAASRGFRPALVRAEIGGNEGDGIPARGVCSFERSANLGFARERADRGAHVVSGAQQFVDAIGGYEAGAAGDENEIFTHAVECTR